MQSLDLGDGLVEGLTLSSGDLELKGAGLAGTIATLERQVRNVIPINVGGMNLQRRYRHPRRYHREPLQGC
jgi:hypothetical protein